ncbi:MAG: hypothetical protein EBU88_10670 [Acidobacteria bacterium]|nr:hypothetical protein [Acidobacteriota bacterium]
MATEFVIRDLKLRVYVHLRFSVGDHFAFTRPKKVKSDEGNVSIQRQRQDILGEIHKAFTSVSVKGLDDQHRPEALDY